MSIRKLGISLIQQYGYVGLMVALLLEFICIPIPGETLMIFVGFQTWSGNMNYYQALIFAVVGTNLGSIGAYMIGKYLGREFLLKYGKYVLLTAERLSNAEKKFEKYQKLLYLLGRFVAGVRHFVPYLSGIYKIDLKVFALYNFIGSIIWCASFVTAGHYLGSGWKKMSGVIHRYSVELLVSLVIGIIVYKVIRQLYLKRKKATE